MKIFCFSSDVYIFHHFLNFIGNDWTELKILPVANRNWAVAEGPPVRSHDNPSLQHQNPCQLAWLLFMHKYSSFPSFVRSWTARQLIYTKLKSSSLVNWNASSGISGMTGHLHPDGRVKSLCSENWSILPPCLNELSKFSDRGPSTSSDNGTHIVDVDVEVQVHADIFCQLDTDQRRV